MPHKRSCRENHQYDPHRCFSPRPYTPTRRLCCWSLHLDALSRIMSPRRGRRIKIRPEYRHAVPNQHLLTYHPRRPTCSARARRCIFPRSHQSSPGLTVVVSGRTTHIQETPTKQTKALSFMIRQDWCRSVCWRDSARPCVRGQAFTVVPGVLLSR